MLKKVTIESLSFCPRPTSSGLSRGYPFEDIHCLKVPFTQRLNGQRYEPDGQPGKCGCKGPLVSYRGAPSLYSVAWINSWGLR